MFSAVDQAHKTLVGDSFSRKIIRRGGAKVVLGLWAVSHCALAPRLVHAQESATETTGTMDAPNGPNVEATDSTEGTDITAGDAVTVADARDTPDAPATAVKAAKKPVAPTQLKAQWAGKDANGHLAGVLLTWHAVLGATSYNVYRGSQVIPRPAGPTTIIAYGVKTATFSDPSVSMGIDVIYHYQITAVNAAGESAKSNSAAPSVASTTFSSATASVSTQSINLTFSAALEVTAANDAAQYTVQVNGLSIVVQSASYNARTHSVHLALAARSLKQGAVVNVRWTDLADAKGEVVIGHAGPLKAR